MAGLLQTQQAQSAPQPMPAQGEQSPENAALAKQKLERVQKIGLAAQKVLYGEKTRAHFAKMIKGQDAAVEASDIAVGIMLILIAESQMKIDPTVIIPAGVAVMGEILDYIAKVTDDPTDEGQVEDAIEMFVNKMMEAVGGGQPQQPMQPQQPAQGAM